MKESKEKEVKKITVPPALTTQEFSKTATYASGGGAITAATSVAVGALNPESLLMSGVAGLATGHLMFGRGRTAFTDGKPTYAKKVGNVLMGPHAAIDQKYIKKTAEISEGIHFSGGYLQELAGDLKIEINKRIEQEKGDESDITRQLKADLENIQQAIAKFEKIAQESEEGRQQLLKVCRHLQRFRNLLDSQEFTSGTDIAKLAIRVGMGFAPQALSAAATAGISIGVTVGIMVCLSIADNGLEYYKNRVQAQVIDIYNKLDHEIKEINLKGLIALEKKLESSENFPCKKQLSQYLQSVEQLLQKSLETTLTQHEYDLTARISHRSIQGHHLLLENAGSLIRQVQSATQGDLFQRLNLVQKDLAEAEIDLKTARQNLNSLKLNSLKSREVKGKEREFENMEVLEKTMENYVNILGRQVKLLEQELDLVNNVLIKKFGVLEPLLKLDEQKRSEEKTKTPKYIPVLPPLHLPNRSLIDDPLSPKSPISPEVLRRTDKAKPHVKLSAKEKLKKIKLKSKLTHRQQKLDFLIKTQFDLLLSRFDERVNMLNLHHEKKHLSKDEVAQANKELCGFYSELLNLAGVYNQNAYEQSNLTPVEEKRQKYTKAAIFLRSVNKDEYAQQYEDMVKKCEVMQATVRNAKKIYSQITCYGTTNRESIQHTHSSIFAKSGGPSLKKSSSSEVSSPSVNRIR